MDGCIFCKILRGELESVKIWENDNFIAILDLMPNTEGMTLVIPKEHYDSYVFDMPNYIYQEFMLASKEVAQILETGLNVNRVAMVMEGMGVNHAHIKLYPLHGVESEFKEMWAKHEIYFDKYDGYISTQIGPKKSSVELQKIADKIKNNL